MVHAPCGCSVGEVDFDYAVRYVDGTACPRKAGDHLWVRESKLVVPTAGCRLIEAQDGLVLFDDSDGRPIDFALPVGDYTIERWQVREDGWLRARVSQVPVSTEKTRVLFPV